MKRLMILGLVAVFVVAMSGMAMAVSDSDDATVTARVVGEYVDVEIDDFELAIADAEEEQSSRGDWRASTNINAGIKFESSGMTGTDDGANYNAYFEYSAFSEGDHLADFDAGGDTGNRALGGAGVYEGYVELTYVNPDELDPLPADQDYVDEITVTVSAL